MQKLTYPYIDPNDAPWTQEYRESHPPRWLEDDDSDDIIYEDALYGVV
jgi:hypothetical protein